MLLGMSNWQPLKRDGHPQVRGPNAKYSASFDVDIELSETPPPEWTPSFLNPSGVTLSMGMHPPISGHVVTIMCPQAELKQYVAKVDGRIKATNDQYRRQVLPQKQTEADRKRQQEEEERKRTRDMQDEADKL
jgi:hypothetical protein